MIRMLLVDYVFAIRSERRICAEVQVNLAYRWFCRLSIEDKIPDHSVFSRARHERFRESEVFRRVFERVVATCIAVGLVVARRFSIDASLIRVPAPDDGPRCRPRGGADLSRHRRRAIPLQKLQGGRGGVWTESLQPSIGRERPHWMR